MFVELHAWAPMIVVCVFIQCLLFVRLFSACRLCVYAALVFVFFSAWCLCVCSVITVCVFDQYLLFMRLFSACCL